MERCERCDGTGKIADSERGEAWSQWRDLPPGSDMAVRLGVVKPIDCPECHGAGVRGEARAPWCNADVLAMAVDLEAQAARVPDEAANAEGLRYRLYRAGARLRLAYAELLMVIDEAGRA